MGKWKVWYNNFEIMFKGENMDNNDKRNLDSSDGISEENNLLNEVIDDISIRNDKDNI